MFFTPLKYLGVFDLLITKIGTLSPFTFPVAIPVKQTLLYLLPVHFSFLKQYVLLGKH